MPSQKKWIMKWFQERSAPPAEFADQNYFELGLIDSFGVIELIDDLEAEFRIKFRQTHIQDRRFATVSGLAEIVAELLAEEGS